MTPSVPDDTSNGQEELLAQLRDLVPSAFLDGELDRDALLTALALDPESKPSFNFTWPGIEQARRDARMPTTATLTPDPEASLHWPNARDALVEGDNLQVLKLLKNGYSRAVKLIYIDPPYNTGDTFTYNDHFAVPERQYLEETGQLDEQGNTTTSRIESGGRKHAPWLTMMFSRLALSRHLLRRDGVILVSIDDNEVHHLRLLLDAIFGAENFVDMMTWQGGRKGDGKRTAGGQDYILIYARDYSHMKALDIRWRERKTGLEDVYKKQNELLEKFKDSDDSFDEAGKELRKWYRSLPEGNPGKQHSHFNQIDAGGVWTSGDASSPNLRDNLQFSFEGYPWPENGWRYELPTMQQLSREGKILYPENKSGRLRLKRYLKDQETWAPPSTFYRERGAAQTNLNKLMGGVEVFDDPKSPDVIARLIHGITGEGDLILDFFAGSGSTAQAVWEQNPKDDKIRHWILVQVPEKPNDSEASGKNALKGGYKTIFEVTAERLRRAGAQLQQDTLGAPQLGFRIFRTRPTNLVINRPLVAYPELSAQGYLAQVLDHTAGPPIVEGALPLDVAWEVALKTTATRLDARVTEHDLDGVTVYEFAAAHEQESPGRLLISLGAFTLATADELGLSDDDTLILRGDQVTDSVTLTLAPRLQSKLILLERVPREVSL